MCRIDAPFGVKSLDEQDDPIARFEQALDEYLTDGYFRSILDMFFRENWLKTFGSIERFERILAEASKFNTDKEKCISLLIHESISMKLSMRWDNPASKSDPLRKFFEHISNTLFNDSPYKLYDSLFDRMPLGSYEVFIKQVYGEEFLYSPKFFNDETLFRSGEIARVEYLWSIFEQISFPTHLSITKTTFVALVSEGQNQSGVSDELPSFQKGVHFLKAWIRSDSKAGYIRTRLNPLFSKINEKLLYPFLCSELEGKISSDDLDAWRNQLNSELEMELYSNFDFKNATELEQMDWSEGLLQILERAINVRVIDFNEYSFEERTAEFLRTLASITDKLSAEQIKNWIKTTVQKDFKSEGTFRSLEYWNYTDYYIDWKASFIEVYERTNHKTKLAVLKNSFSVLRLSSEISSDLYSWRNQLLKDLVKDCPKVLIPDWFVVAKRWLEKDFVLPYAEQSVGIIRGILTKGELEKTEKNSVYKNLQEILLFVDLYAFPRSIKPRMMLMRTMSESVANEKLSVLGDVFGSVRVSWYLSLSDVINSRLAQIVNVERRFDLSTIEHEMNLYHEATIIVVEYCLSRLKLKKGEKIQEGFYSEKQVTEQSSIWRQCYLKMLSELGYDLNGKVHKAIFFTRKSDPDASVRAIAAECYKSTRRHPKSTLSLLDLKRGLKAAEWWLLLAQRNALGGEINYDEALKTRRNILRNIH